MKEDKFILAGFSRIKIVEDGKLKGDSGWMKNRIVSYGLDDGIGQTLAASAGSKLVAYAALGTGTAPASNSTSLAGEIDHASNSRNGVSKSVITSATGAGVTVRYYGTFSSSDAYMSATADIQNIGLFAISNLTAGTILSGNTYATSNLNTNQDVQYSYEWRFATA